MRRAALLVLVLPLIAACASTAEREAAEAKRQQLVQTHLQLANGYLQRGQIEVARDNLVKALDIEPYDPDANNLMALVLWRLDEHEDAERHFRRALREDDKNAETQNNYGAFLCARGRTEEAVRLFTRASRNPLYRTPAVAYENAGLCLAKAGDLARAEPYFREALRFDARRPASLLHMARISYDAGRALPARGFIQRYFELAQDTPESLLLAVRIEQALRNKDQEASYALRLRARFPDSPEARELRSADGRSG